jgi:hypothetical protein
LDRAHVFKRVFDFAFSRDLKHPTSILASENILNLDIALDINMIRDRAFAERNASAIQDYMNFYTIQERIAGRSPAFEGIRLVKERIK